MSYVLLTGGAGYIGSHTALELLNAGYQVLSFDNFSNSSDEALKRVQQLTGKPVVSIEGDIRDDVGARAHAGGTAADARCRRQRAG